MIRSITYDDTLYQLVPKEATQDILSRVEDLHEKAWMPWQEAEKLALSEAGIEDRHIDELTGNTDHATICSLLSKEEVREFTRTILIYGQHLLSAAPTPPAQPEAKSNEWTLIAPDGARFTGPSPGKTAIEASKHHMETDPEAREKFLRAIKQIAEEGRQEREQCMRDYGTLDCPHCGGSGHIADAVANGHVPQPEDVRVPLTDEQITNGARALCRLTAIECGTNANDEWAIYGEVYKENARAVLAAAYGITAAAPKEQS